MEKPKLRQLIEASVCEMTDEQWEEGFRLAIMVIKSEEDNNVVRGACNSIGLLEICTKGAIANERANY